MKKKIKLTIDGKEIFTREGKTVLEAAQEANIYIPTLCYHLSLTPFGGCRLCIVEIEGMKGFPISCTTPVSEGMKIQTTSPELQDLRRQILELILTEHPNACLICQHKENCDEYKSTIRKVDQITGCEFCPNNNKCELQEIVKYIGIDKINLPSVYRNFPIERTDPFFDRDYNLCILCGRCVRVCRETRGAGTLTFAYRGPKAIVGTAFNRPHLESGCQFCGACVDVCPTGALADRGRKWEGIPDETAATICPYCGVGCQLILEVKREKVISAFPGINGQVNHGQVCVRGRFTLREMIYSSKRILNPMIRKNGQLEEVIWEEALDFIAEQLAKFKGDQFALISSTQGTNEDYYLTQKFVRVAMKTNNVDNLIRLSQAAVISGLNENSLSFNYSLKEIEHSGNILLIGSDISYSHPVVGLSIKRAVGKGAKLTVIDFRRIKFGLLPYSWFQIKPGTDHLLFVGMAKLILEKNLIDLEKLELEGIGHFKDYLKDIDFKTIEDTTGLSVEKISEIVDLLIDPQPATIIYGTGITQSRNGAANVQILTNLALLSQAKLIPLWPESNARGACDLGLLPNFFPGYQKVNDSKSREKLEKGWKHSLPHNPGLTLPEIIQACEKGQIKALYIIGDIPWFEKSNLEFFIVQNPFFTEICELADVILPSSSWAETEGTFTNTEGRIQLLREIIKPLGNSKPDWWILTQIGKRMGIEGFNFTSPAKIMDEIKRLIPGYQEIFYSQLKKGKTFFVQLPQKKKKTLFSVNYSSPSKLTTRNYPFLLVLKNNLDEYRGFSLTKEIKGMRLIRDEGVVELNPEDAHSLGISQGEIVKIISQFGETKAKAELNGTLPQKTAFMMSSSSANSLLKISSIPLDPVSKTPESKLLAVKIIRGKNV